MATVYLVSRGSYSDYCIEGVFSTRALAEAFVQVEGGESGLRADIEEWEVDEKASWMVQAVWTQQIDLRTGALGRSWVTKELGPPGRRIRAHSEPGSWGWVGWGQGETPEVAQKMAVEARQAWLRAGKADRQGDDDE